MAGKQGPALEALIARFAGEIVQPDHPSYDDLRALFNAMVDKRPAIIARCASTEDVRAALAFGLDAGLPVAVRSGGHSVAGLSTNEGGLVIDTRLMNQVEIDASARTATVGGGALWGDLDPAAGAHGLGVTGGRVSTTGIAGFTLGGGSGWIERKLGLACDSLLEVEVVTADGRVVVASERSEPELFWALHGGGGNFGVATRFTLGLHEIPEFSAALLMWRPEDGKEVTRAYRDLLAGAPDDLGGGVGFLTAPPEEFVPEAIQGTIVCAAVIAYTGSMGDLETLIAPLVRVGPPVVNLPLPVPYHEFQHMLDDPAGNQNWWTADYHDDLPDAMLDEFCDHASTMKPSPSQMLIVPWGGAVARVSPDSTPMTNRNAAWVSHPFAVWPDPAENEERIAWARALATKMKAYSTGATYLNFIGDEGQDRVIAAYGPDNYARLQKVKREFDPTNVFRGNQNIKPGA